MKETLKKMAKALFVIWTVFCSGIAGIAVATMVAERKYKYKLNHPNCLQTKVEYIFSKDDFQDAIATLKLKKQPTLSFETLIGNIMETSFHYYKDTLDILIIKTVPDYVIKIDLTALLNYITMVQGAALSLDNTHIEEQVIKMLLLHECRHIAQAEGDFFKGKYSLDFSMSDGYGNRDHEKDANNFAVSCANNDEYGVFQYVQAHQESIGNNNITSVAQLQKAQKRLIVSQHKKLINIINKIMGN